MKNILLMIVNIVLLSTFNVLFRFSNVLNDLNSFNNNSSVIGGYMTTSNVSVPYLKIFILSFILNVILFLFVILILKKTSSISFSEVIYKLNFIYLLLFIIVSIILLFFNIFISFFVLIIGFIIFLYFIYKNFCFAWYYYFICLIFILYFLIFYFISF